MTTDNAPNDNAPNDDAPNDDAPNDDAASSDTTDETAYADAVAELEEILTALEDDNIDVDALASKVERASKLITLCRDRIGAAKVQVEQVVADLDHQSDDQVHDQPEAE